MTVLKRQVVAFLFVGGVNTVFGYAVYAGFVYLGVSYPLAILFSTILGVLFNFKSIGYYVFNVNRNSSMPKFILVYSFIYSLNVLIVGVLNRYGFDLYLSGIAAIIPASIFSFILNKYYVFKT